MKQNVCKKIETTKTNNVSYDYEWVLLCTVVPVTSNSLKMYKN